MIPNVPQIHFVDRPEVSETFADSIKVISFDGQTMRIEFCVTRMDEPKPPVPPTGRQYPVCRLVLAPNAGLQLQATLICYNRASSLLVPIIFMIVYSDVAGRRI